MRRGRSCPAVYLLNGELLACGGRYAHWRRHKGRLVTTADNGAQRPLWASTVTIRWEDWRPLEALRP